MPGGLGRVAFKKAGEAKAPKAPLGHAAWLSPGRKASSGNCSTAACPSLFPPPRLAGCSGESSLISPWVSREGRRQVRAPMTTSPAPGRGKQAHTTAQGDRLRSKHPNNHFTNYTHDLSITLSGPYQAGLSDGFYDLQHFVRNGRERSRTRRDRLPPGLQAFKEHRSVTRICRARKQPLSWAGPSATEADLRIYPELFMTWSLSPSKTWMCSLPLTKPAITYLFLIWTDTSNSGLTVTFFQGHLCPACLVISLGL